MCCAASACEAPELINDWVAEEPPAKELAPLLLRGVEHVIEYHAVAQGSCWARIPDGPFVQMFAGDVVMYESLLLAAAG